MSNGVFRTIKQYRYLEEDLLGSGTHGKVYLGINIQTNLKVAIKIINLQTIDNQVTKYLLQTQKLALRTIQSPNVIHAIDIFQKDNLCYIITEYCEGGTLKSYLDSKLAQNPSSIPIISQNEALSIIMKICSGLSSMSEKGFIHRDLKTANIMLRRGQLVIIDLGYSDNINGSKPKMFYNVGTPSYMSPQAYMQTKYSFKSDVWAVGVIFYELLFGKTLDKGQDMNTYFAKMAKGLKISIPISSFASNLLANMVSVNSNERPNAQTIVQAIKQYFFSLKKLEKSKSSSQMNSILQKNNSNHTQNHYAANLAESISTSQQKNKNITILHQAQHINRNSHQQQYKSQKIPLIKLSHINERNPKKIEFRHKIFSQKLTQNNQKILFKTNTDIPSNNRTHQIKFYRKSQSNIPINTRPSIVQQHLELSYHKHQPQGKSNMFSSQFINNSTTIQQDSQRYSMKEIRPYFKQINLFHQKQQNNQKTFFDLKNNPENISLRNTIDSEPKKIYYNFQTKKQLNIESIGGMGSAFNIQMNQIRSTKQAIHPFTKKGAHLSNYRANHNIMYIPAKTVI